jgi:tetratricopeptide (TPR) repeat protein
MRCLSAWSRAQPDGRAAGAVGPEQTSQRNTIAELIMKTISSAAAAPQDKNVPFVWRVPYRDDKNVPFVWRVNYRNDAASPEKTLEIAHEQAREYLSRAVATTARSPPKGPTLSVALLNPMPDRTKTDISSLGKRCEDALELLLTHRGNPAAEIDRILVDDPHCTFGHCLRAAILVSGDVIGARPAVAASVSIIEAASSDPNHPARRHAAGARAWLRGDQSLALEYYGAIVIDWPRDILALFIANALDFRFGRRRKMRDRIAQVLPEWHNGVPGFASVLAMYAFALEENGQYRRAEKMARRALMIDPEHPGAIHVVAHVLEMQGRAREGLAFLAATESAWAEGNSFSIHLAWHRALFQLDMDDPASALATYDAQIVDAHVSRMSVLADASALLWRLQLRDIEVGSRWQELADHWQTKALAGARPFYVVHAMMAFAAAGRTAAAGQVLEEFSHNHATSASLSVPEEALVTPFCEALLAFVRKDYAACVGWLTRVRHIAHRCGGSVAQCDLIHLTFTEAALRAQKEHLARALVAERATQKPTSRLNQLLQRRLRIMAPLVA